MYCLKCWISAFLNFKMIYSMPKNKLWKYSKFHLKVIVYVVARFWVLIRIYELQAISFNLLSQIYLLSNSFHNLHFSSLILWISLLSFLKLSSCFTLLELVRSISSLFSTMIENDFFNLYHFHPLNLRFSSRYMLDPWLGS